MLRVESSNQIWSMVGCTRLMKHKIKNTVVLSFSLSLKCIAKCCNSSTYVTALIVIAIKQDNGLF